MPERRSKSVYVVKSKDSQTEDFSPKKQSETRSLYVLRTCEEAVNKYADVIDEFVAEGGIFYVITRDKIFYQTIKNALCHDMGHDNQILRTIQDTGEIAKVLSAAVSAKQRPFLFMEHALNGQLTISQLQYIEKTWPQVPVVIVARDVYQDRLFQFHEEGADNFLTKPACSNTVIEKIAYTLQPQCEIDALLAAGRQMVTDNRFEEAIEVAQTLLGKRPNYAAALVILGDALKGLARREQALAAYQDAEKHAKMYLEPLKRLIVFYAEDQNNEETLRYLVKLDKLSPLNCNRKIKIAEMHIEQGRSEEAEKYFDRAIDSAREEAMSVVSEMCLDIADMVADNNPKLAEKYYRKSLEMTKNSRSAMCMNIYNRLGISLRKQGMWQEAIEAYFEAEKHSPKDENIQYNIALAYGEGGDFKNAAERVLQALGLNPTFFVGRADVVQQIATLVKKANMGWQATEFLKRQKAGGQDDPETASLIQILSVR